MTDECHAVLKAYAAFFKMSMGDVMYMFARQEIQLHSLHCKFVSGLLDVQGVTLDKRIDKPCWGFACLVCNHVDQCRCGLTDETFYPKEDLKRYLKPESPLWDLYED